jgi:diacylglycerol kinase (ATP)
MTFWTTLSLSWPRRDQGERRLKVAVIVNPAAGGGRMGRLWPGVEVALRHRLGPLTVASTKCAGDGRELARTVALQGAGLVVAAGGDGTVSEVVGGLLGSGRADEVDLGIVPVGTGADLGRTLGFGQDFDDIAAAIAERPVRRIDAGFLEFTRQDGGAGSSHFINIASLGISGDIAAAVNASGKRLLRGKALFAWHTVKELMRFQAPELTVRVDGSEVFRGRSAVVAIANNHSFAGGMMIAPDAELDDGWLNVVTVRDAGRLQLIGALRKVYDGSHRTLDICGFCRGRQVEVEPVGSGVRLEADGEPMGFAPVRARILPAAIRLRW